jgi:hypothetical protein
VCHHTPLPAGDAGHPSSEHDPGVEMWLDVRPSPLLHRDVPRLSS